MWCRRIHTGFILAMLISCSSAADLFGQSMTIDESSCRTMFRQALERQQQSPDPGMILRRVYQVRIIADSMGQLDTASFRMSVTASSKAAWIQGDHYEVRSDESFAVRVDNVTRTLNVIDLRRHRRMKAAQQRLIRVWPDSLAMNSTVITCTVTEDGEESLTLVVDRNRQRFYNADTIRATVNADGEFAWMHIIHPKSSFVRSTEYRLLERQHDADDEANLHQPVLAAFFEDNGTLRSQYAGYRVKGLSGNRRVDVAPRHSQ